MFLKCFLWKTADLELRRFRNDGAIINGHDNGWRLYIGADW